LKYAWLSIALVLLTAFPALAEVTVLAEIRPPTVAVGETFQLEVRARATGLGGAGEIVVPQPANVRRVGHSSSTSLSLVNGRASQEKVETFSYIAEKPGRLVFQGIGSRSGRDFTAGPVVSINVMPVNAPPVAQAPPQNAQGAGDTEGFELPPPDADVFVTAKVDKPRVRVGEPLVYTFRFYFRINPDQPTYDAPDFSGFQTYDLGQSKQSEAIVVHGRSFEYFDLRTLLYPLRAGELTIGPAALSFRTSFFFTREYRRKTKPLTVQVEALPENPPPSFHGAVGTYALHMSNVPASVAANEPVTMQLTIAGTGNFGAVGSPEPVSASSWRIYPGRISDHTRPTELGLQGEKSFELLLQPPGPGRHRPPAFRFTYFDPAAERYVSLVTRPTEITIRGDGPVAAKKKTASPLALRPVRTELGDAPADPARPWKLLLWLVPLPFLGLALLAAGSSVNRRLQTVTPADRRQAADRRWEKELNDRSTDARTLLRALDQWLHETHGLSASPTESEIKAALGSRADALLHQRRRLESAVFGATQLEVRGVQQGLREWMSKAKMILLAAAVFVGAGAFHAVASNESPALALFRQAQLAQVQGNFSEAVRLYKRSAEHDGVTVNLLYNLAGAAWRSGETGLARFAIETAFSHARRDADIAANRKLIAGAIAAVGGSEESVAPGAISLAETGWMAVGLWSLFSLAAVGAWFFRPLRWTAALLLVLCFPVWGYASYLWQTESREAPGVLWQGVSLKEAASNESAEIAPLPAGEVVRLEKRQDGWLKISTPSGLSGWISEENWRALELVKLGVDIPD
jgi:hypothetical protein